MKRLLVIVSALVLGAGVLAGCTERSDRVGERPGERTPSASPSTTTPPARTPSDTTTPATPPPPPSSTTPDSSGSK